LNRRLSVRGEHIGPTSALQVAGKAGDSAEMQFEKTDLNDYNATGIFQSLIRVFRRTLGLRRASGGFGTAAVAGFLCDLGPGAC
jgi:hypothetical protein